MLTPSTICQQYLPISGTLQLPVAVIRHIVHRRRKHPTSVSLHVIAAQTDVILKLRPANFSIRTFADMAMPRPIDLDPFATLSSHSIDRPLMSSQRLHW